MMSGASNQGSTGPQGMSSLLQAYVAFGALEKDFS